MKEEEEEGIFQVESILDCMVVDGEIYYLIRWAGYSDPKDYTWEPINHLPNCTQLITEYWQSRQNLGDQVSTHKTNEPTSFWDAQQYPFITFKKLADEPLGPKSEDYGPFGISQYPDLDCSIVSLSMSEEGVKLTDSNDQTMTLSAEVGIGLFPDIILDALGVS